MTEWALIEDLLARSGWPDAETVHAAGGWEALPDADHRPLPERLPHPRGRFRLKPDWSAFGPDHARMPTLPDHLAITDEITEEHPYRLVAAPARQFLNTTFTSSKAAENVKHAQPP
jgi:hypothetical protein